MSGVIDIGDGMAAVFKMESSSDYFFNHVIKNRVPSLHW